MHKFKKMEIELPIVGVYLLKNKGETVYVGQSSNIRNRVSHHINATNKVFDCIEYVEEKPSNLNNLEASLIVELNPTYNNSLPSNDYYKCKTSLIREKNMNMLEDINSGKEEPVYINSNNWKYYEI